MPTFIALLRGINMGGHKKVAMSDLRATVEAIGFADVQTLLQSGNLLFSATTKTTAAAETQLETALAKHLNLTTRVLVRTATEWKKLVAANPFAKEAQRDPSHLALMLLKDKPSTAAVAALKKAVTGREVFEADGRALYAYYPDGFGNSKFTTALIDRTLSTTATARNWNTVLKIATAMDC
jgi:uncharacterized protein (DUF1697 family)